MLTKKVCLPSVIKIIIGLADDLLFFGTEKPLERMVAAQINSLSIFEPDQVGNGFHQSAVVGFGFPGSLDRFF